MFGWTVFCSVVQDSMCAWSVCVCVCLCVHRCCILSRPVGSQGYCKHPWLEAGVRFWGFQSDVCSSQLLVPSLHFTSCLPSHDVYEVNWPDRCVSIVIADSKNGYMNNSSMIWLIKKIQFITYVFPVAAPFCHAVAICWTRVVKLANIVVMVICKCVLQAGHITTRYDVSRKMLNKVGVQSTAMCLPHIDNTNTTLNSILLKRVE